MRFVLVLQCFSSQREFPVRAQLQRYVCGALQLDWLSMEQGER
jgi:hypothetical protein